MHAVSWCNKLCLVVSENHNNYNDDFGGKIINGSETCAHVYQSRSQTTPSPVRGSGRGVWCQD